MPTHKKKRILQLDGGGAKGVIQIAVLSEIEKRTGRKVSDIFDLIVGTSVGSIIGGSLATGKMSAQNFKELMCKSLPKAFKKRFPRNFRIFTKTKYSRKPLVKLLEQELGKYTLMRECKTKFVCTSVCVNDGKNHYFKSWEDKDSKLGLIDVINRSYAAPYFFGAIDDPKEQKTWLDGGTGNSNCSLHEALIEAYKLDWIDTPISILSIGTGYQAYNIPFKKSKRWKNIRDILFFMMPGDGGLARNQSTNTKILLLNTISKELSNLTFQRLDKRISKKIDKMDGVKYIDEYLRIGESIAKEIDYDRLGL